MRKGWNAYGKADYISGDGDCKRHLGESMKLFL